MTEERWIHAVGYDTLVYVTDKRGYCYPLKEAKADCPVMQDCITVNAVEHTTERALISIEDQLKQHLRQVHKSKA